MQDSAQLNHIQKVGSTQADLKVTNAQLEETVDTVHSLAQKHFVFEPYKMLEALAKDQLLYSDKYQVIPIINKFDARKYPIISYAGSECDVDVTFRVVEKATEKELFNKTYHGHGENGQLDAIKLNGFTISLGPGSVQRMEAIASMDALRDVLNQFVKDFNSRG